MTSLRDRASGKWEKIYGALSPELLQAYEIRPKHSPCPIHGGKLAFRFFKDETGGAICSVCGAFGDGFKLLERFLTKDFRSVATEVEKVLGIDSPDFGKSQEWKKFDKALAFFLNGSRPGIHGSARFYLERRMHGLGDFEVDHDDVRTFENLRYPDSEGKRGTGILLIFRDHHSRITGVHAIFVDKNGNKLGVKEPKTNILVSPLGLVGSLVELRKPVGGFLGIAEGYENALAVEKVFNLPVACATTASILAEVRLPSDVTRVGIFLDRFSHYVGLEAAAKVGRRYSPKGVKVDIYPPGLKIEEISKAKDWNDQIGEVGWKPNLQESNLRIN